MLFSLIWMFKQRRCFSVLFERWYNIAMFFSVISTFMQRHHVFHRHFNVYATSLCFSVLIERSYNVAKFFSVLWTMTLKNIAMLYQRSNNTEKHSDIASTFKEHWTTSRRCRTFIQRREVFQCSLNVDAKSLCFSVLFERWYNVTMFFSVIWTLIQRHYVFQRHFKVDTTSLCFSVLFERWWSTLKWHWKT
jgi:ubiquitin-protein ligase